MIKLIHQGQVFAPEPSGKKDILILGKRIGAVCEPGRIKIEGLEVHVVDASEKIVIPGFIDSHVHLDLPHKRLTQPT